MEAKGDPDGNGAFAMCASSSISSEVFCNDPD
jgi:hypothetical protein